MGPLEKVSHAIPEATAPCSEGVCAKSLLQRRVIILKDRLTYVAPSQLTRWKVLQGQVREVAHFIELMNHSKEFQCIQLKEQRN